MVAVAAPGQKVELPGGAPPAAPGGAGDPSPKKAKQPPSGECVASLPIYQAGPGVAASGASWSPPETKAPSFPRFWG